jgi:hypothetical protein
MSPTPRRVVSSGLLAGLIVNLIDVPNSAILVSPKWMAVLGAQGITPDVPAISVFFTLLHFAYGVLMMALASWLSPRFGSRARTGLLTAALLLLLNRGFGLGAVVMGQMPLSIFLQFSWSMVLGSLLGGFIGGRVLFALPPVSRTHVGSPQASAPRFV